jgi:glutamyl-tRNA reductase
MRIGVLGINFKSAEIGTRELVSKACQKRICGVKEIGKKHSCIVLSTCNRTEIYFSALNLADAHSELLYHLREEISVAFEHKLYSYFGFDCFMHLAQVTAGLDSAIVCESEIQRQVKIAYEQTALQYHLPSCMHYLFQKSLKLGKEIRSNFSLFQNQVTIAKILFEISQQLLKDLAEVPLLFVGNSEINRKVMAYFKRKGIEKITLCTRSMHAAEEMAEKQKLSLLLWTSLSSWKDYPVVICGSNASSYIVSYPDAKIQTRLVFDLSVPRNVDPVLSRHPTLTLLNMEELSGLIETRQTKNSLEMNRAEVVISKGVECYLHSFREKEKRVFACA